MTGTDPQPAPGTSGISVPSADFRADPDEIALIAAGLPRYQLWRECVPSGIRYVATARDLDAHPHTLVTASLDELTTELAASRPAATQ